MAEIDISDAVGAGVGLVTRRPLAVLAWGLLPMTALLVVFVLFGGGIVATIVSLAQSGEAEPRPEQVLGLIGAFMGAIVVLIISAVLVGTMVRAAAFRAVLEPEQSRLAYLRLGGQELWVFVSLFVLGLILVVVQIALVIPLSIVTAMMGLGAAMSSGGDHPEALGGAVAAAISVRLIGQFVIYGVTIWLWLRLCLGPVMSFRERQFRLFESWTATKGHAWRMFAVMLLVYLIVMVVVAVAVVVGFVAVAGALATAPGISDPKAFFSRPPAMWMGALAPAIVIIFLLGVVVSGIGNAVAYGALARMYRQLFPSAEVASTFT